MCLAVPGELISLHAEADGLKRAGRVSFGGVVREVNLAFVPEARVGDFVNVHVGFALSVIDAEEAARVFETLEDLDAVSGELS